jgi:hypothetical protein
MSFCGGDLMARPKIFELLKKKEFDEDKKMELEKGDFLALILAAASVFLPVIIGVFVLFGLIALLFAR